MAQAESRALVPVTVKMLVDDSHASDRVSQFCEGGITVRLVGRALEVQKYELNSQFQLKDGTGGVCVNYWYPVPGENPIGMDDVGNGCYVDVVGKPVKRGNQLTVQAFLTRKVIDFNEITHHFLYSIHAYMERGGHIIGGQPNETFAPARVLGKPTESCGTQFAVCVGTDPVDVDVQTTQQDDFPFDNDTIQTSDDIVVTQEDSAQTTLRRSVMGIIIRRQNEEDILGVEVKVIVDELGAEEKCVREALRQLHEVGEIYETVDAEHYAAT